MFPSADTGVGQEYEAGEGGCTDARCGVVWCGVAVARAAARAQRACLPSDRHPRPRPEQVRRAKSGGADERERGRVGA
eukprot:2573357-Rhodomonas_salina.1